MIYSPKNLTVCAYWYDRPVRGGEFLDESRSVVQKVGEILPELLTVKVVEC